MYISGLISIDTGMHLYSIFYLYLSIFYLHFKYVCLMIYFHEICAVMFLDRCLIYRCMYVCTHIHYLYNIFSSAMFVAALLE